MDPDKRSAWLRKLDKECPYQVVLPRRQLSNDSKIMDFLLEYVGKFDMYVEDECAAYVRYCFADPMDAAIFRSRFEPKSEIAHRCECSESGGEHKPTSMPCENEGRHGERQEDQHENKADPHHLHSISAWVRMPK